MTKRFKVSAIAAVSMALVASVASTGAFAQTQSVKADLVNVKSTEKAGEQELVFEFAGVTPSVRNFTLKNPNRLVIDFMSAANRTQKGAIELQGAGAKSVEFAGDDQRLRAVVQLHDDTQISERWNGSNYVLTLSRKSNMAQATVETTSMQPTMAAQEVKLDQEILRVDYRKGKSTGSGRLAIDLSNASTPIDVKTAKNGIIIDFMGTSVPAHLQKKFELADQMTPASSMELKQLPDRTRVILRAQGKWQQNAYQVENKFVFEIQPVFSETVSANKSSAPQYKGDKLTLNFQNIEVRTVIQVLSEFSGINMITSDTVGGNITLRLKDVPWDQALALIMEARNLDSRKSGNVIWIAPQVEIRNKEKAQAEFLQEQELNKPMITEAFQINYTLAQKVASLLTNSTQRLLSKRGSAVYDDRTNTLFVQDIPERIESARGLIKQVDIPVKQVMIEARIVEATETFGKSIGARLGYNDTQGSTLLGSGARTNIGGSLSNTASNTGQNGTSSLDGSYFVNLPTNGLNGKAPGLFSFILFNSSATRFLNLELSALVADGKGQILSNPRVVTADKQEAVIEQGTEIPYQQASSSGATNVAFKKASLALKVKPQITPDGNVLMDLQVNKDSVGAITAQGPAIDTKNVKTQVLVEDGGTVVIGGIFTQEDRVSEEKVPFFGDLPYLGHLFKTRSSTSDRREMLVFVSPKIVGDKSTNEDIDASAEKEELIKPIIMDPQTSREGLLPPPLLPIDVQKAREAAAQKSKK